MLFDAIKEYFKKRLKQAGIIYKANCHLSSGRCLLINMKRKKMHSSFSRFLFSNKIAFTTFLTRHQGQRQLHSKNSFLYFSAFMANRQRNKDNRFSNKTKPLISQLCKTHIISGLHHLKVSRSRTRNYFIF